MKKVIQLPISQNDDYSRIIPQRKIMALATSVTQCHGRVKVARMGNERKLFSNSSVR